MSKLERSNEITMQQIEWNKMMDDGISQEEVFEILEASGVDEITWNKELNREYRQWIYFNMK